jgi:hypothetical protein
MRCLARGYDARRSFLPARRGQVASRSVAATIRLPAEFPTMLADIAADDAGYRLRT